MPLNKVFLRPRPTSHDVRALWPTRYHKKQVRVGDLYQACVKGERPHLHKPRVWKLGALEKARLRKVHSSGDFLGVLIFSGAPVFLEFQHGTL